MHGRLALAWLLAGTALLAPATATAATDGGLMSILVMGDSYSAGNGAGSYYGAKGCRRSANNYGRQYARLLEAAPYRQRTFVETVACSGDTTQEFFASRKGRQPQLSAVDKGYDLIFLTIGGNDLKFSKIVKYCLVQMTRDGANCGPLLTEAERAVSSAGFDKSISDVLRSIRGKADSRARIVILGYPYLEGDTGYRLRSGHGGRTFIAAGKRLHRLTNAGDRLQRNIVERLNKRYKGTPFAFVSTRRLFAGPPDHSLFAQKTNRNRWFIQPLVDVANIDYDLFYHPNPTGWLQEAKLLLRTGSVPKGDLNSDAPTSLPAAPAPGPVVPGPPPRPSVPPPVTHITLLTPTAGPVGYQPTITGPECAGGSGERPRLRQSFDGAPASWMDFDDIEGSGWAVGVNLTSLEAGKHRISFTCVGVSDAGVERVIWSDPGFEVTLTGTARVTSVQATTVRAGDEVGVISGATRGTDPCPALFPGSHPVHLHLSLLGDTMLDVADIALPSLTSFEPLDVPLDIPVGTSLRVSAHCLYALGNGTHAGFDFRAADISVIE